jgi:CRISPR-associated exonuclease Cas4
LLLIRVLKRRLGVLVNEVAYLDSDKSPGELLYAKSINLVGKPDYLVKQNKMIIPVEVKTGATPAEPYLNHVMQLMAYCLLVEENYGIRPVGGYLKYPKKEFKVAYNDEAKTSVVNLITEITQNVITNEEFFCDHPQHNKK